MVSVLKCFGISISLAIALLLGKLFMVFNSSTAFDAYYPFRVVNGLIDDHLQTSRLPFVNKDKYFPDHSILERHFDTIKAEVTELLAHRQLQQFRDFDDANSVILQPWDKWRVVPLILLGTPINTDAAPRTLEVLKQCRGVRNAFFSVLEPFTRIGEHTGNFLGVVRYHLCLQNPAPDKCRLVVNGTEEHWHEGESFMFDDMFPHSAYNDSPHSRVILFLDITRVDIPLHLQVLDYTVHYLATYTERFRQYVQQSKPFPSGK